MPGVRDVSGADLEHRLLSDPLVRNRFDQLGKELGLKTLGPLGTTDAQYALNAETLFADLRHEPDPGRDVERQRLGLLGALTRSPCLLELYSQPPGAEELRACMAKHLTYAQERLRHARGGGGVGPGGPEMGPLWTWIVSAGVPRRLLADLAFRSVSDGARGLYVLGGDVKRLGMNLGLVVASELPLDTTTLLVRIMAGGPGLASAVRELASLPEDAHERIVAEPVVLRFQHALEHDTTRPLAPEEKEFIMVMHKSWKDARAEGRAEVLRRQLRLKFGELSPDLEQRVSTAPPEEIDRYLERILFADSIETVFA
jgi:hypothetical protein